MSQLDSSWNLEDRLKNINCSENLKSEILKFIELNHKEKEKNGLSLANIYYRANLHYIEDNINKEGLVNDLIDYNNKIKQLKK